MLTVVVSTKNEALNIDRCLSGLRSVDDVVVVDSGSTDATSDIARAHGRRVINFAWDGHFPKKRNWTLRNVDLRNPWVLFLDADEVVNEAFLAEVRATLPATTHVGFWVEFTNHFLGKTLRHGDKFRKLALIRVGSGEYERIEEDHWSNLDMEVHEQPVLSGSSGALSVPVEHNDFKGLAAYIARHNQYSSWEARRYRALQDSPTSPLSARQKLKYRNLRRWWFPVAYFAAAYIVKGGLRDGAAGLAFWLHKAFYFYQVRLKILELEHPRQ